MGLEIPGYGARVANTKLGTAGSDKVTNSVYVAGSATIKIGDKGIKVSMEDGVTSKVKGDISKLRLSSDNTDPRTADTLQTKGTLPKTSTLSVNGNDKVTIDKLGGAGSELSVFSSGKDNSLKIGSGSGQVFLANPSSISSMTYGDKPVDLSGAKGPTTIDFSGTDKAPKIEPFKAVDQ